MDHKAYYSGQEQVAFQHQAPQSYPAPPPTNHTTVIRQQPRNWSSGICSCFDDCGSCMLAICCPLILSCQVASQMGESLCVPICVPNYLTVLRTKLRAEQNIQGTVMDDWRMVAFCGTCVLCQLSRELKYIRNLPQ